MNKTAKRPTKAGRRESRGTGQVLLLGYGGHVTRAQAAARASVRKKANGAPPTFTPAEIRKRQSALRYIRKLKSAYSPRAQAAARAWVDRQWSKG